MIAELYDRDRLAWAEQNARLIKDRRLSEVDLDHVAEELEAMGGSGKRELLSRLSILMTHLLKWRFEPALRSTSWRLTIINQRDGILDLLEESPSLQHTIGEKIEKAYGRARKYASLETGLSETTFPVACPYSLQQLMDVDFWPEEDR